MARFFTHPPIEQAPRFSHVTQQLATQWARLSTDGSVVDLVAFGESIGLRRSWLQGNHGSVWRFDLTPDQYMAAVRAGAISLPARDYEQMARTGAFTRRPQKGVR